MFPTGREWARDLGYPEAELARVPDATVDSFAGVANPFSLGRIEPGETVLDLGCGAGTDLLIAAQMTGPAGRALGIDMTPAMLERARTSAAEMGLENVQVEEALIEDVPFDTDAGVIGIGEPPTVSTSWSSTRKTRVLISGLLRRDPW